MKKLARSWYMWVQITVVGYIPSLDTVDIWNLMISNLSPIQEMVEAPGGHHLPHSKLSFGNWSLPMQMDSGSISLITEGISAIVHTHPQISVAIVKSHKIKLAKTNLSSVNILTQLTPPGSEQEQRCSVVNFKQKCRQSQSKKITWKGKSPRHDDTQL